MTVDPPVAPGDAFGWTRSITVAEVLAFGELVGDQAQHHRVRNNGPVTVHGLLLMGMVSQLAATFHFIGHEFAATFHAPAFCGRELTARMVVTELEPLGALGWATHLVCEVFDQRGQLLLTGSGRGVIPAVHLSTSVEPPATGRNPG